MNDAPDQEQLANQMRLVESSGLFDERAYRAVHPDVRGGADAVRDYLENGFRHRNPFFDGEAYLAHYGDVREAGVHPLVHYLEHGRAEGRNNIFARPDLVDGKPRLVAPLPSKVEQLGTLAMVVRVHAPELLAPLLPSLAVMPAQTSLFIAVHSADAALGVRRALQIAGLDADCRIIDAAAPDLAAPLVLFAQEVLRHDFVLSLVLNDKDGAQALHSAISRPLVETIIRLFSEHPRLGLVYPRATAESRPWSEWMRTGYPAALFLQEFGLGAVAAHTNIAAPMETTFWSRVDALRPLLSAGLTMADAVAMNANPRAAKVRALERSVCAVARGNGYTFVQIDDRTGELRDNWTAWDIDDHFRLSVDAILTQARGADIVSFDVFDTLLMRECARPEASLRLVGVRLAKRFPGISSDFLLRRMRADYVARLQKGTVGDVGLEEIYAAFNRDSHWTDEVLDHARHLEQTIDADLIRIRPGIRELLTALVEEGARIVAISDTYYSEAQIKGLLQRAGIAEYIDRLYISSEQGARKDRGDLWDKVLSIEGIEPTRWLHVGDNERSDVHEALKRNLRCVHLLRPIEWLKRSDLNFDVDDANWATDLAIGPAINVLTGPALPGRAPGVGLELRTARDVGLAVFGPIMFGFVHWMINHPTFAPTRVFFASRDGYVLERIYSALRTQCPSLALPAGKYLYTSRRAALGASLGLQFDPARIVHGASFTGTMLDFLDVRLGLAPTSGSVDLARPVTLPGDEERVIGALESLRAEIVDHAIRELAAYRAYLEQSGFGESDRPTLVDVGYSCSIQAALQDIAGRPMDGFYFGTSPIAHQVETGGGAAHGYLAAFEDVLSSAQPAMAFCLLLEAFLVAPHGQVASFVNIGGSVVPQFRKFDEDETALAMLADMQQGAADYCTRLTELYGEDIWRGAFDRRVLQEPFRALVEKQIQMPQQLRSLFSVENEYCGAAAAKPMEMPNPPWNPIW